MIRRISGAFSLALVLALSVPTIASADVTIGSTTQPTGSTANKSATPTLTYAQLGSTTFPAAVPVGGGRITSWSTNTAGATAGATVNLVVLQPSSGGSYTVIAVDSETLPTPLPPSNLATFTLPTPIPVNSGDAIGLNTLAANAVQYWSGGSTPLTDVLGALSASTPAPPATGQTVSVVEAGGALRANVSAVVSQSMDAGVTATTAPGRPSVGNPAVLGSTVTNHSTNSGSTVFTDSVPSGLTINSVFAANASCNISGQTVTCTMPNLGAGDSVPVNVLVTPRATGSYVNHVSVTPPAGWTDPNPANNTATATLKVDKTAPNACAVPKLRGTPAGVAKRVLKLLGCKVKVKRKKGKGVARGTVLKSKPKPGTYRLGRKVTLIVRK